jgi:hypothetical protein
VRILEDLGGNSSPQQINLIINILNDFLNSKGKLGEVRKEQDGDFKNLPICANLNEKNKPRGAYRFRKLP